MLTPLALPFSGAAFFCAFFPPSSKWNLSKWNPRYGIPKRIPGQKGCRGRGDDAPSCGGRTQIVMTLAPIFCLPVNLPPEKVGLMVSILMFDIPWICVNGGGTRRSQFYQSYNPKVLTKFFTCFIRNSDCESKSNSKSAIQLCNPFAFKDILDIAWRFEWVLNCRSYLVYQCEVIGLFIPSIFWFWLDYESQVWKPLNAF